ncbi:MAG: hypothetical protein HKN85_08215 [Gammaproteobacteria bacterium]|nr:hypothetical protein [Gammaproteobacteria bacterium]
MKNTAFAVMISILVAACSSGTAVTELPQNATSRFQGTYQNTPNTQSGVVIIDIFEDESGQITGNIIFQPDGLINCLRNAAVSGNSNGFNISLVAPMSGRLYTITTTITEPDDVSAGGTVTPGAVTVEVRTATSGIEGTTTTTSSNGTVTTVETTSNDLEGDLNMQFALANNGNTLNGTYTTTGNLCSNQTGSGTMNLSS